MRSVLIRRTAMLLILGITSSVSFQAAARETRLPVRAAADAVRADLPAPDTVAFLGVVTVPSAGGLEIVRVVAGSSSARAGLRTGDVLRRLEGVALRQASDLDRALEALSPGGIARVAFVRDGALTDRVLRVGGRRERTGLFRGGLFRLAVVPVRFADDTGAAPASADLRRFFFESTGARGAGASLADYFTAQSLGSLRVDGRVLAPVRVPGKRADYAERGMGAGSGTLFSEATHRLATREGAASLRDVDGLVFLHPGAPETRPGRALWPHRAAVALDGRRLPYYVHAQSSVASGEIGEHCHEFAHLLGLADEYGVGHRTGSGDFCVMGIGHRGAGRDGARSPFSLCASCRVRLGWLPSVIVDPRVPQRLRLSPSSERGSRAVVVPLDEGTREFLLLEVRRRAGFDAGLPSEGLLVWRVGGLPSAGQGPYGNRVDLVEAHGIDTFDAALVRTGEIAFPTGRARDLTPETVPASDSGRPGGLPVHLTDIRRARDGSIEFTVGVRRHVSQVRPVPLGEERLPADGIVERIDPVTGRTVLFDLGPRPGSGARDVRDSR